MVEMTAHPGGQANNMTWLSDFNNKGGFAREWFSYLSEMGVYQHPNYNPYVLIPYFDTLLANANVRTLYLSMVAAPVMEENRVTGAIIETKSGRGAVRAKIVIDATGDGDIAARSGAEVLMGRESDGACQAISLASLIFNWNGLRMERDTARDLAIEAGKKNRHRLSASI